jgi:hypothetical protein
MRILIKIRRSEKNPVAFFYGNAVLGELIVKFNAAC